MSFVLRQGDSFSLGRERTEVFPERDEQRDMGKATDNEGYALGPDSLRHEDVPRGTITHHTWRSRLYAGSERNYWTYVPAQYRPHTPACLMVWQDGHDYIDEDGLYRVPAVTDNLLHLSLIHI